MSFSLLIWLLWRFQKPSFSAQLGIASLEYYDNFFIVNVLIVFYYGERVRIFICNSIILSYPGISVFLLYAASGIGNKSSDDVVDYHKLRSTGQQLGKMGFSCQNYQ